MTRQTLNWRRLGGGVLASASVLGACAREPSLPTDPERSALAGLAVETKAAYVRSIASGGRPSTLRWQKSGPGPDLDRTATARRFVQAWASAEPTTGTRPEISAGEVVGRAGRQVMRFEHRVGGIPIWQARTSVLLTADGAVSAVSGFPEGGSVLGEFELTSAAAANIAWNRQRPGPSAELTRSGTALGGETFELRAQSGPTLMGPALVRPVYFRAPAGLTPAYSVAIASAEPGQEPRGNEIIVSAVDGSILAMRSTLSHAHSYRVWTADAAGTPAEGPLESILPYPTSTPSGVSPAPLASKLIEMEGFNHNPSGMPDAWLEDGATSTNGNNVDAYVDFGSPDGLSGGDFRATVTSPGVFDHVYDLSEAPLANDEQGQAAIVQAFYTTNWLHDWYYDSGFDEVAKNAQADNYGRGGFAGDVMHVQVQDDSQTAQPIYNNAAMMTPPDGISPVMHVYLWSATVQTGLLATPGGQLPSRYAAFGPTSFDVSGQLVAVNDGTADTMDACQTITQDLTGKIALIRRGGCEFVDKANAATTAGAVGIVIANNDGGTPPIMDGASGSAAPSLSTSMAAGDQLVQALAGGSVTVQLSRTEAVERDGAFDGTIVAHEWGHYLQERLAPCAPTEVNGYYPEPSQCYSMGEGGSDFVALHMLLAEGNDPALPYPMAAYAAASLTPDLYFGLRRYPYSTSMDINPLTFRMIADGQSLPGDVPGMPSGAPNSEVHNAGEIWSSMLFEVYAAMVAEAASDGRSFDEIRRSMSDDLVLALSLMSAERTLLDARDAVLAAIAARHPPDAVVAAEAFAKRGAGSCAAGPAFDSTTNTGVVEQFDVRPELEVGLVVARDAQCENGEDGVLDAGETGVLAVEVVNVGYGVATGTVVSVAGLPADVSAEDGTEVTLEEIPPLSTVVAEIPVSLADISGILTTSLTVTIENDQTCEPTAEQTLEVSMNYDLDPAGAHTDDFSSDDGGWTLIGPRAEAIWRRTGEGEDTRWHGDDTYPASSTALVSPPLEVSVDEPFQVTLNHRYSFERSQGTDYDGAVIEVSLDDGATWQDVLELPGVDPGYTGSIVNASDNPLTGLGGGGRPAFVGPSPGYPNYDELTIDFGDELAGQTVRLAFRIGTDQLEGAPGWDIDDVTFSGTSPGPFTKLMADTTAAEPCPEPPPTGGTTGAGGATGENGDGGGNSSDGNGGHGADGSGASSGTGGAGTVDAPGGCGCRVSGGGPASTSSAGLALLALGLLARRRRQVPARR